MKENRINTYEESIIITSIEAEIEIEHVDEAFVQAAGYSREEVVCQNPRILQSGKTPLRKRRRRSRQMP